MGREIGLRFVNKKRRLKTKKESNMDIFTLLKALLMGIVEGLTEFLPISSTGHLIVLGDLLNFHSNGKVFEIAIQLGAVLAVLFKYRQRFTSVLSGLGKDRTANRFVLNLAVAFVPAAVVGLLFSKQIKLYLFNPITVATMLVLGGFFILWVEKRQSTIKPKVKSVDEMRPIDALVVGCAQICALVPGTSRSGSTIMGGMLWGIERKAATEFSFFLAVPMMIAATGYDIRVQQKLCSVCLLPHRLRRIDSADLGDGLGQMGSMMRPLQKSPSPRQPKPKHRFSAVFGCFRP